MSELARRLIAENKRTKAPFLDLGNCGLKHYLPNELLDCVWLKRLNLGTDYFDKENQKLVISTNQEDSNLFSGYKLAILEELPVLQSLYLRSNQISYYSFLERLTRLQTLDLSNNQISDIRVLEKLTGLQTLDLSNNQISDIRVLEKLTGLQSLNLSNNQISDIRVLEKLTGLQSLDLSFNKISGILFLEKLTAVKSLNLNSNNIFKVLFLGKFIILQSLNLKSNNISDAHSLEKLTGLESLDLSNNKISDYSFLEKLTRLKSLNLSNNKISDYSFLEKFTGLESLDLSSNQISDYSFLEKFTALQSLDLSNNQISDYSFLEKLTGLKSLDLSSNQISDYSFLEKFTALQSLDLSKNKIRDLKSLLPLLRNGLEVNLENELLWQFTNELALLKSVIRLKDNPIANLRLEIVRQGRATAIRLKGIIGLKNNPIVNPPLEIVKQGREAVIRYFEKIELEGRDYIYEAKLTLVGDGGAGKTSLQRRILDCESKLPTGNDRTRGIKVYDWPFKDGQGKTYITHIWDFGGQDVYYPVHRFFLTENSVYVLMASTRFPQHNFDYWIPTIYQFGGQSPIVLVQNCDNGHQKNWEDVNIFYSQSVFNLCKPHLKIDLPNQNTGLEKLKNYLQQQIIGLPHIGKSVPKSWVKVREALMEKAKKDDCFSFEKFAELCCEVDAKAFDEAIYIEDLGRFMHDLGIILWYYDKDLLRNLVILKPEWAMNAVYKIIDDGIIQDQNQGVIHQADFERIWCEPTYKKNIGPLKAMLEVFKIAFPKKHQKQDYIIPARLLPIPIEKRWGNNEQYLRLEYYFDFMPRGIVNQVSAELSKYILSDESVWDNAVIFKQNQSEAQVTEEYHNRKILIKTKGRDARGMMLLIMHAISNIVNEYRGVQPSLRVPCSCSKCQNQEKSTIFEYEDLIQLSAEDRETVTCNKSDQKLNIEQLLYSIGLEQLQKAGYMKEKKFKSPTSKPQDSNIPEIFFSYAWGDATEAGESREKIVDALYESLKNAKYKVRRDKVDLGYKGLISDFISRIGRGDFIVVAISDKYLRSVYCMFELYEIYRNSKLEAKGFIDKIYPIRVENLKLDDPDVLDVYFEYWENLERKWEKLIVKHGTRITTAQKAEHDKIKEIASKLGDLLDILKDMNALSKTILSDNNFAEIKKAIEQKASKA